jgi:hypothetical protein
LPGDLATAQAQVLGAAAGQATATEATREALSKAVYYGTKYSIRNAIDSKDKKDNVLVTTTEIVPQANLSEIHERAARRLLNHYYESLKIYERD